MSAIRKRSDQIASDQAMIDGIQKFLSSYASLYVGSQTMTPAAIVQVLQDRIDANKAAQTADDSRTTAVKANKDKRAQTTAFEQSLRSVIRGMFSQSPDSLAVFGLKPRKVSVPDAATKQEAVAKRLATRKARHTMGPKQKLEITGTTTPAAPSGPTPVAPATPTTPTT